MIYKDIKFQKFQEKQRQSDPYFSEKSERRDKRQREMMSKKFHQKIIGKKIDIDWWTCLSESDRSSIIKKYYYEFCGVNNLYLKDIIMSKFIIYVKSYKPNIQKLRDKKLEKLFTKL